MPITPNLLSQKISKNSSVNRSGNNANPGENSKEANIGNRTPLRDEMKINVDEDLNAWENNSIRTSEISSTNKPQPKGYVKNLLSNLPKPSNNYEIDIMDSVEPLKENEAEEYKDRVEDEEERLINLNKEKEQREMLEFLNQSKVIQKKLVRPVEINQNYTPYDIRGLVVNANRDIDMVSGAEDLRIVSETYIKEEMLSLLQNDAINYPVKGGKVSNNSSYLFQ